ncbi:MAG: hypothetical protein B6D64_01885 [Bacteroidetes bacterium 4484_276]|nr:MAG: hypothetical protein B6D64_01885 [Bacteroidetes bacterium 4484_276]OYT13824.1 MAG: hypothetical protein B6I19_03030 [Bacteroidetes bacterium 4572_114]
MRKIAVLIILIFSVVVIHAQQKNVQSAYRYLGKGKLDKAKEYIDMAVENESTMTDAKAWKYRGMIYYDIFITKDEEFKGLDDKSLDKSYESFKNAMKLDKKDKYKNDIILNLSSVATAFYQRAYENYQKEEYIPAGDDFFTSYQINNEIGANDTITLYYSAMSYFKGKDMKTAKNHYLTLAEMQFEEPEIYTNMAKISLVEGDTLAAIDYNKTGRELYPDDLGLIFSETNIYMALGENDKSLELLNLAIDGDPSNKSLYFAAGTIYEKTLMYDQAKKYYEKAINVDPDYFEANYNLGALYFNKAVELLGQADALNLNEEEKYNALKDESEALMQKAVPYLEKADSLESSDKITLQTLKEIYTRLNMLEKLKGVNERLAE